MHWGFLHHMFAQFYFVAMLRFKYKVCTLYGEEAMFFIFVQHSIKYLQDSNAYAQLN
jgi:hypothetical protein